MDYTIKGDRVTMDLDGFMSNDEIQYINFILGYDLLHDMLKKSSAPECDISYDFCDKLARKFVKSKQYQNTNHSMYEMLEEWLKINKSKIKKDYKEFIGDKDIEKNKDMER